MDSKRYPEHKIVYTLFTLKNICNQLKNDGKIIAFTNGCFDLVHCGSIMPIEFASTIADIVVVGVNSDSSIKELKGEKRPILNERDRLRLIASLEFVDYVILFDGSRCGHVIEAVAPHYYVKGNAWDKDKLDKGELECINKCNAQIIFFNKKFGLTSSRIINNILTLEKEKKDAT